MRRLRSLVAALPEDSATARACDPLGGQWSTERELMAQTVDYLAILNTNFARANSKAGTSIPNPRFIPRPGDEEVDEPAAARPRRMSTPNEIRAFFGGSVRYTPRAAAPERSN